MNAGINILLKYQNKKLINLELLKNIRNNVDYLTGFVIKLLSTQYILQQSLNKNLILRK
jgi:hypothetical protein